MIKKKEIILDKRTIIGWVAPLLVNFVFDFYNIEEPQEIILLDEDSTKHTRKISKRSISGSVLKERERERQLFPIKIKKLILQLVKMM